MIETLAQFKTEKQTIMDGLSQFAVLDTSSQNDLPDSSFAIILPGGKKDETGKTVPRSLRKLPYKTASGSLDRAHVIAAWAALQGARGGVDLPADARAEATRKISAARRELGLDGKKEGKKISQFAALFEIEEVPTVVNYEPTQEINSILGLNDQLISTLEQADSQLQVLSQLNQKLSQDVNKLELDKQEVQAKLQSELESYKQKEQVERQARLDSKLNTLTDKWCDSMKITDATEREEARKMLSAFSEDKLATIESQISRKLTQMQNVPQPITKQSDELASKRQVAESTPVIAKQVHEMTPEERKAHSDRMYELMVASNYKTHHKKT